MSLLEFSRFLIAFIYFFNSTHFWMTSYFKILISMLKWFHKLDYCMMAHLLSSVLGSIWSSSRGKQSQVSTEVHFGAGWNFCSKTFLVLLFWFILEYKHISFLGKSKIFPCLKRNPAFQHPVHVVMITAFISTDFQPLFWKELEKTHKENSPLMAQPSRFLQNTQHSNGHLQFHLL